MKKIAVGGLLAAATLSLTVAPASATDDLNCGDEGTSHNMPIDPDNDPNNLDGNDDGVGCEDPSDFPTPTTTATTAPPADDTPPPADDNETPAAAAPIVDDPQYTG